MPTVERRAAAALPLHPLPLDPDLDLDLDLERCPLPGTDFSGQEVLSAIRGHILGKSAVTVRYSLNPRVMAELVPGGS